MIIKLRSSFLLPAELSETFSKYIVATEQANVNEPFVATMIGLLKSDINHLNGAIARLKTNSMVDSTVEANQIRYDLILGFRNLVLVGKRRPNPAMVKASDQIMEVITNAGLRSEKYGYTQTSGILKSLFQQLDMPANLEAIQMLNAAEIYAELKEAETEFLRVYALRIKEEVATSGKHIEDFRSEVISQGATFIGVLNTLKRLEPEVYPALAEQLNGITSKIMATARARRTRSENGEADGENDQTSDDVENPFSDDVAQSTVIA